MSEPIDFDSMTDEELIAALGEAVGEAAAVSDRRRDAARAAFTWRTVDSELAALLHDSSLDAGAAVRSSVSSPRDLSFGLGDLVVELEITGSDCLGEVVGGAGATVTLQRPDADDVVVEADVAGFFRFTGLGDGPIRFVVVADAGSLTTPWVTL
jgi:hypothetical protein